MVVGDRRKNTSHFIYIVNLKYFSLPCRVIIVQNELYCASLYMKSVWVDSTLVSCSNSLCTVATNRLYGVVLWFGWQQDLDNIMSCKLTIMSAVSIIFVFTIRVIIPQLLLCSHH